MPYRYAWVFVLAVFPLTALAFWRGYLSTIATAPAAYHVHGITATLWLVLLAAQSFTIHNGRAGTHRALGAASLALFPLFMAGGAAIFVGMAQQFVAAQGPFYVNFAPRLAWLDFFGVLGFAWLYHEGLRTRGDVRTHSRYMLATLIFLLPPIVGRLMPALPPLTPTGPGDFVEKLGLGFQIGNGLVAALAFAVAARAGRHGGPFWIAGGLTVAAALAYQFVGPLDAWRGVFAQFAGVPWAAMSLAAAVFGIAVATSGWFAGRKVAPSGAAPA